MTNKTDITEPGSPSPQNCHHASPGRKNTSAGEDWDPTRQRNPFPSNRNPRVRPPLILPPPFGEPPIAALATSLDSHRDPALSSPPSNFLVLKAESTMASSTIVAT